MLVTNDKGKKERKMQAGKQVEKKQSKLANCKNATSKKQQCKQTNSKNRANECYKGEQVK